MKILRQITIAFVVFMLLILAAFFYVNGQLNFTQRDLIYYNDQLHKIEREIQKGEKESVIEKRYHCNIILSTDLADPELAELYRNSAFILDLAPDGEYIGKVAWTDLLDQYNSAKFGFFSLALVAWIVIFIGGVLMLIYFYRYLLKPVDELKGFSEEIAKGNLEVKLPIHKRNIFGEFVEAFDLMREQLIAAKNREIKAEKARKELVSELSHDIKTPVSVIKATCEVIGVKVKDEDTIGKVEVISQKAETISQLVSHMMHANLDDLEEITVIPTEENSLIIADFFKNLKQYGNIVMENEIPGCLVYMDRLRLEQAIDNVVGNSYKYAGTDIHVRFDSFLVDMPPEGIENGGKTGNAGLANLKKAEFLRIRIRDDGPGVNEDELPLIAEKYYRGSNSAGKTGSGLGFFLVKYYMEKMKGGLEYYNNNGFVVELLLKKV